MDKFWCVFVEGTGGFREKHYALEDAQREAERLARLPNVNGKKVYVLEVVSYCQVEYPVTFHEV